MIWFYVEYWLPGDISGQHIVKKGKVRVKVHGEDKTPPQIQWVQLLKNECIEIRAYDGTAIENIKLVFMPNKEKSNIQHVSWEKVPNRFEMDLVDNGSEGDKVKGDGIYSITIQDRPSYFYDLNIEMTDVLGNRTNVVWPETIFLKGVL